jgi:putative spermidine/putrescine transport system ATP-binding protein
MTLSDRIAVFNAGRIEQIGSPAEVYEQPSTAFVAGFVGTSNLFETDAAELLMGSVGRFSVRPERMRIVDDPDDPDAPAVSGEECLARGSVAEVVYAGAQSRILVDLDGGPRVTVSRPNGEDRPLQSDHDRGRRVAVAWRREHAVKLSEG